MIDLTAIAVSASRTMIDALPDDVHVISDDTGGFSAINPDAVEPLANAFQLIIANVIAAILDAGSERDSVIEDEILHNAIVNQLKEWI